MIVVTMSGGTCAEDAWHKNVLVTDNEEYAKSFVQEEQKKSHAQEIYQKALAEYFQHFSVEHNMPKRPNLQDERHLALKLQQPIRNENSLIVRQWVQVLEQWQKDVWFPAYAAFARQHGYEPETEYYKTVGKYHSDYITFEYEWVEFASPKSVNS